MCLILIRSRLISYGPHTAPHRARPDHERPRQIKRRVQALPVWPHPRRAKMGDDGWVACDRRRGSL